MVLSRKELDARKGVQQPTPTEVVQALAEGRPPEKKRGRIRDVPNPVTDPVFRLVHPDSTETDPVRSKYIVSLPGKEAISLRPEFGVYETSDVEVRDHLVKQGFRQINQAPFVQNDPAWAEQLKRLKENT